MVIQRIQSVYLLLAVILMIVFAFFPALSFDLADKTVLYGALESGRAGHMHINPLLITLIILISFLAIIDIFLFKNLQRQMTVCFVDIIIGISMLIAICILLFLYVIDYFDQTVSAESGLVIPVDTVFRA